MPTSLGIASLLDLRSPVIHAIADSLIGGPLRHGITLSLLQPLCGSNAGEVERSLTDLVKLGVTTAAMSIIVRGLAEARQRIDDSESGVFLAISGPDVPGTPVTATTTTVRSLFEEAQSEVIVASYAFHAARDIFSPLAERLDKHSDFRVRMIVDLTHYRQSPCEPAPIVITRFKNDFRAHHWSGSRLPSFWHDHRKFVDPQSSTAGVMHAKAIIIDQSAALVTSANFTEAAQNKNIEAGILLRHPQRVIQLKAYFDGLIATKKVAAFD